MGKLLTTEDHRLVLRLQREKVLKKVIGNHLCGYRESLVVCGCADGHQICDVVGHLSQFTDCPQFLSGLGGALFMSPAFHDRVFSDDKLAIVREHKIYECIMSMHLKKTNKTAPMVHYPCGMGALYQLTLTEYLYELVRAKLFIQRNIRANIEHNPLFLHLKKVRATAGALIQICGMGPRPSTYWVNDDHPMFADIVREKSPILMIEQKA